MTVVIRPMREDDFAEARRILSRAFGTFLGLPDPMRFAADQDYVRTRFTADPDAAFVAEADGRLIGSNFATRWGSFGFFGPISVDVEHWNRGIAKRLLEPVMGCFDRWGVSLAGLYTFAQSPKHVGLYSKYGFWPRSLTAILSKPVGDGELDGFAVCHVGEQTEAGPDTAYVKFGAVQAGAAARQRFDRLLDAVERFAQDRGVARVEAGVNMARDKAFRALRERGYRVGFQGIAMHRPSDPGYSRSGIFAIDDWR